MTRNAAVIFLVGGAGLLLLALADYLEWISIDRWFHDHGPYLEVEKSNWLLDDIVAGESKTGRVVLSNTSAHFAAVVGLSEC